MPRYDDRHGNTRLYVGHLSSRTRTRDLEDIFSRYGRVRNVDMKHDYAFIEFSDPRDADDARYGLNGRDIDGSRIIVELAKGVPRGPGGVREYAGRGPPPGSGRCFNCGLDGHWARDCKAGDWKNKCYRCGERGHIERNCQSSPKSLRRGGRSYSRSPSPRRRKGRSYSRSHSYSRSRSPAPRRSVRKVDREDRRSRSPPRRERSRSSAYSRSPKARDSLSPAKGRKHSLSPDGAKSSPQEEGSPIEKEEREDEHNGSGYNESPARENSRGRSPMSPERESSPVGRRYHSPETNGRSPSPKDNIADDNASPRGSESPQD